MPNPKTTSGFPLEFATMWELATEGKLIVTFERNGQAISMRQRLYAYRAMLAKEAGPAAVERYYNVELFVEPNPAGTGAILRSGVSDWKQQVRALAGQTPAESPSPVASSEEQAADSVTNTLHELGFGKEE